MEQQPGLARCASLDIEAMLDADTDEAEVYFTPSVAASSSRDADQWDQGWESFEDTQQSAANDIFTPPDQPSPRMGGDPAFNVLKAEKEAAITATPESPKGLYLSPRSERSSPSPLETELKTDGIHCVASPKPMVRSSTNKHRSTVGCDKSQVD